ncbi:hypothetical protein ACSBR1_025722 [Camellia fascicularis]
MSSLDSLRTLFPCLALVLLVLFTFSEGGELLVGGQENSWKVPQSPDDFNKWAGKMRFLIGDSLVLEYDPKSDSVLEVTEEDYKICNTVKPIKAYNDSNTKIVLNHSGLFYFICGAEGHCEKGQKLLVRVLSAKRGSRARPPVALPAPAPSPVELLPPAPVPTADGGTLKGEYVCMAMFLGSLVGLALMSERGRGRGRGRVCV